MTGRSHAIASFAALALAIAAPTFAQTSQDLPISAKTPADFKALREMPLFAPDRSVPVIMEAPPPPPAPVVEVEAPTPPPPAASAPDWQLVGLVRSDRVRSAMFRSASEPEFTLKQGESRDGWTLVEVGRFDVTLDSAGGRASMRFPENTSVAPPPMMNLDPQL